MSKELIPEFKKQNRKGILKLIAKAGRRREVDCVDYSKFCPITGDMPIYAFIGHYDIVVVMIDWCHDDDAKSERSVYHLTEFIDHYKEALSLENDEIPPILGVIVSNTGYSDLDKMKPVWEAMDVKVFDRLGGTEKPKVCYAIRYHAVALAQYKQFRMWCEKKGYLERDPFAFEDIDADYDEMEFDIDDEDDNLIDDSDNEDDFEAILRKFVEDKDDLEVVEEHKKKKNDDLPFPKEMNDRVANIKLGNNQDSTTCLDGVADIEVYIKGDRTIYDDSSLKVIIKGKPGVVLSSERFCCHVYTDDYYPVCMGDDAVEENDGKNKQLGIDIFCSHVWVPGKYILVVSDSQDYATVTRIDFTLDEHLEVSLGNWIKCGVMSAESTLVNCLDEVGSNWNEVACTLGTSKIRKKLIRRTQTHLLNEFRKEVLGELPICSNMLVCMNNPSYTFLAKLQIVVAPDYNFRNIDCSKLFDVSHPNPYEMLPETLNDVDMKVLCLTRLSELYASSGKVIMKKITDTVRQSHGKTLLWLCGTHREVDEVLSLFPSLKSFFQKDSWLVQKPNTIYELVQSFSDMMVEENIYPSAQVMDRLARTIIKGSEKGCFDYWVEDDIKRFIESEILPRYINRVMANFNDKASKSPIEEEDVPFEKLTDTTSSYEQSISGLNAMIGLDDVKHGISTMANQARLFIERRRRGLKTSDNQVYHSIFTGNPGTGKTTVARQLGKIYHSLGLLSKGEVIAVDRSKLVGQYIGQTEENMKAVLEEAKGNVLFIDEAYTLFTGDEDPKDFGRRVLDSLLTVLTQPNPDMLIVFAGYTKQMDVMLSTNPGLSGRFPYRYHFDDYSSEQLMEIAQHLFEREEYTLTDDAAKELQKSITDTIREKPANFGNARWVEQFVRNGIIPAMADRIFSTGCNDYQSIEASDVRKAFEKFNPKNIELKPRHRVAGFNA